MLPPCQIHVAHLPLRYYDIDPNDWLAVDKQYESGVSCIGNYRLPYQFLLKKYNNLAPVQFHGTDHFRPIETEENLAFETINISW